MKKLLKAVTIALAVLLTLTACSNGGNSDTDKQDTPTNTQDTLIAVLTGDPTSFHPDFKSDDSKSEYF